MTVRCQIAKSALDNYVTKLWVVSLLSHSAVAELTGPDMQQGNEFLLCEHT